jgi:hypothetical protein
LDIFVVIVLALVAGVTVYQLSMRAGQPHPRRDTPGIGFVKDALEGISRFRDQKLAATSGSARAASESFAPATSTGAATQSATAVATEEPAIALDPERTGGNGDVAASLVSGGTAVAQPQERLYGGSLPPVTVPPDELVAPSAHRYVPLATGYRSFTTRVIGFVGLVVLVAILSVAITVSIYVASSAVLTKLSGHLNSPAASAPTKVVKPGSQGSHHATPGSAAG